MLESAVDHFASPREEVPGPIGPPESSDHCGISKAEVAGIVKGSEPVYQLDDPKLENQLRFFKHATGIHDPLLLKSHIMKIRSIAYERFPYPCIWACEFLIGKSLVHPFYPQIKKTKLLQADKQQIFIDFGSFVGVDLRQVVNDGWSLDDVLGVDIHNEWQDLGLQLFNDADRPPPFFRGDIFNPDVLDVSTPVNPSHSVLDLRALKDLNELKGRAKFISAHQVFHLFSDKDQTEMAKRLSLILSNEPGSAIFGTQLGLPEENLEPFKLYLHSPKSWEKMWMEALGQENIVVNAELEEADPNHGYRSYAGVKRLFWLHWSVLRK